MEIAITYHAIDRFRQRIVRGLSFDAARECLQRATQHATQLREKSVNGHSLWAVEEPPMRLVTKDTKDGPLCVTILPPEEPHTNQLELLEERVEEMSAQVEQKREKVKSLEQQMALTDSAGMVPLEERLKIVQMEWGILSLEISKYREREKTLRLQISAENEELKQALKWAVRAIQGEASEKEALRQIKELNLGWVSPSFYQEDDSTEDSSCSGSALRVL